MEKNGNQPGGWPGPFSGGEGGILMERRWFGSWTLTVALLMALMVGLGPARQVAADPGDLVASINLPNGCFGIGVAYDGTDILFTCSGDNNIYRMDMSGNLTGTISLTDAGGAPVVLHAISWDAKDQLLWGGNVDGQGGCRIYSADLGAGVATLKFTRHDPNCQYFFVDGVAWSPVNGGDELYYSPDVSTTIYRLNKHTGALIDTIDVLAVSGHINSGLTQGLDGTLFTAAASDGVISLLDPEAKVKNDEILSPGGRDEDLECGPAVDGVETILSRDIQGRVDLFEAVPGQCVSAVGAVEVAVDIKYGSDPNSINCGRRHGNAAIPVTVFTDEHFDATAIDPATVVFGPAAATEMHGTMHLEDVDGDGDLDATFHFRFGDTGLDCDSTEASISGQTTDGTAWTGTDAVRMVGGRR